MTREIYEPAKPAYYTVIPSAHCPKGSSNRYVTAPLQATPSGGPVLVAAQNQPPTEVEKRRDIGATVSGAANIVVKDNLTYEEYQRAVELLREIENGTHHVESGGVLQVDGAFTTTNITYHNEITSVSSPGGMFNPLLVDIERELRVAPIDPNGVRQPIPNSKVGFVPLGGESGSPVAPDAPLPESDPTRIVDARTRATNQNAIISQTSPTATRDMINKYTTYANNGMPTTGATNGDKAVVSNDVVLFEEPGRPPLTVQDTPTVPRDSGPATTDFK